ncbi:uncharacterized protein LOC135824386 [Sycon ciliatum]|uniref:uncharacterized protein LOC135824386 n=1 Tax=Sycon ciliatum TaxID=27933 RepID=UPI0020AA84F6|eukprot:scpid100138/ scgid19088/ 
MSVASAVASLLFRSTAVVGVGGAVGVGSVKGNVWGTPAESAQIVDSLNSKAGVFDGTITDSVRRRWNNGVTAVLSTACNRNQQWDRAYNYTATGVKNVAEKLK